MYGLPFTTVLLALAAWRESKLNDAAGLNLALWLTFCAAGATFAVVILRPFNLRRCYRKMRNASGIAPNGSVRFSFDESGVTSSVVGRSEGRFYWNAIQDFAEDDRLALLFIGKKHFLYIPKRAMNEEGWKSLRAMVQVKSGIVDAN